MHKYFRNLLHQLKYFSSMRKLNLYLCYSYLTPKVLLRTLHIMWFALISNVHFYRRCNAKKSRISRRSEHRTSVPIITLLLLTGWAEELSRVGVSSIYSDPRQLFWSPCSTTSSAVNGDNINLVQMSNHWLVWNTYDKWHRDVGMGFWDRQLYLTIFLLLSDMYFSLYGTLMLSQIFMHCCKIEIF